MQIIKEWEITVDIKIAEVDNYPEEVFQKLVHENLLNNYPSLSWRSELSEKNKAADDSLKALINNRFKLRLVVLHKEKIIGLTYGWQLAINHSDFYMGISVIEESFRNKGLYSELLDRVLNITKEKGFSAVKSRHINTNNPVLIAKLKKGFIINGFELDESMGALLKMSYYHNDIRKKASLFRSGHINEKSTLKLLQNSITL